MGRIRKEQTFAVLIRAVAGQEREEREKKGGGEISPAFSFTAPA